MEENNVKRTQHRGMLPPARLIREKYITQGMKGKVCVSLFAYEIKRGEGTRECCFLLN